MQHITKALLACALAGVLGLGLAAPGVAAPLEQGTGRDAGSEDIEDFCGSSGTVTRTFEVHFSFLVNPRGKDGIPYFLENLQGTETFARPSTGGGLRHEFRVTNKDQKIIDNGDGTLTILVQSTGSDKFYWLHGPRFISAGLVSFEILIDHGGTPTDPSDDEFLDFLGYVALHGRLDTLYRDFCEDWFAFTG